MKRSGARIEGRRGGHHIVHEHEVEATKRFTIYDCAERARNVAPSLTRCQLRLRLCRARPREKVRPDRYCPMPRQMARKLFTLVVAPLTLPRGSERNRHQRGTLRLDVRGESQRCHAPGHRARDVAPPLVLERVHEVARLSAGHRIGRSPCANVRGQQGAPGTVHGAPRRVERMTTAITPRSRQFPGAEPAAAAREVRLETR